MSYQQIAETLNASVPQVKTWIHRARRQLEGMLKDYVESGRKEPARSTPARSTVEKK
jgi:DNA-directed RNA polymerase specialized sigma24 family protein